MELINNNLAVQNSIVTETYKKGLNLVLAKEVVFRCYIHRVALNKYRYVPGFQKISDFTPTNYKVWFFKKIDTLNNSIYTTWKDIESYSITCVGELSENTVITFSSVTGLESDMSKEEVYNCPASGYIFSYLYKNETYIKKDWNYDQFPIDPLMELTENGMNSCIPAYTNPVNKGLKSGDPWNKHYWETNYSFASGYDSEEYLMYNIGRHLLPEDCAGLQTANSRFKILPYGEKYEAIVITYGDENLPVVYNELHRANRFINGYINIDWSPEGIITVK